MNQSLGQFSPDFKVSLIPAANRDKPQDGVSIEYPDDLGYAEYSKGAELETAAGDVIEDETAELDVIFAGTGHRGIGTKLLTRLIEETRRNNFKYIRVRTILNPLVVKMVERALDEGQIQDRAYRAHRMGDLFDLSSDAFMEPGTGISPDQATEEIGKSPRVECVIEL